MPTVILLDTSLSMIRPFPSGEPGETITLLQLAINGINHFLDHLAQHDKLEFVAVVTFSSSSDVLVNFTRDFDYIRNKLAKIEEGDKAVLETGLSGVSKLVSLEWGSAGTFNVVLFTDDGLDYSYILQTGFPLPFPFIGKLHILSMAPPAANVLAAYHRIVEMQENPPSCVLTPETVTQKNIIALVKKLIDVEYVPFVGILKCGNLTSKIGVHPAPEPCTKIVMGEPVLCAFSDTLDVCGFINMSDLGSPMAVSRHLVTPLPSAIKTEAKEKPELDDDESDDGKIPSFCVLFHGALKVENVAGICLLGDNWYGLLYSWADNKKKSNLMLAVLEPGDQTVPWLGSFSYLVAEEYPPHIIEPLSFPVRPLEKRSYCQNTVVWIRRAGLQSDMQKILRQARKLPEKTQQFYKELNRLRKAAVNFGFIELMEGMATILERECSMLPPNAHQECAVQLRHAAENLRRPMARDPKYLISPLKTRYQAQQDND